METVSVVCFDCSSVVMCWVKCCLFKIYIRDDSDLLLNISLTGGQSLKVDKCIHL